MVWLDGLASDHWGLRVQHIRTRKYIYHTTQIEDPKCRAYLERPRPIRVGDALLEGRALQGEVAGPVRELDHDEVLNLIVLFWGGEKCELAMGG